MFGLPPIAALAISANVERAVHRRLRDADPLATALARAEARLQALRERLEDQPPDARDADRLEELLAHACARIEEWTAG
jgi:hypothetical protein